MLKIKKVYFIIAFVIFIVVSISVLAVISSPKQALENGALISPEEVSKSVGMKENAVLVDVRRPEEYEAGHLQDSILLTLDTIATQASKVIPDKNKTYYIYCRTGRRSGQAVEELMQMGYKQVHSMDGGITAWQEQGHQIIK